MRQSLQARVDVLNSWPTGPVALRAALQAMENEVSVKACNQCCCSDCDESAVVGTVKADG